LQATLMLDGPLVFVDVDTQRDFLEPSGALYVTGSSEIVPNLARLTRFAGERGIPIIATACAHTPGDAELNTFPPHCMLGTRGQERIEATACDGSLLLSAKASPPTEIPAHLTVLKREFDVFTHPLADHLIALYGAANPCFVVYGVATDYCVKAAVEGLLARHCRVALVVDAIRAIDAETESRLLTDFARRGVLLALTEVVCGSRDRAPN
jgi:nicotinamidase/pyrazinamidase